MKWSKWFIDVIAELNGKNKGYALSHILNVAGVRERWLQGQLYLESTDEMEMDLESSFKNNRTRYDFVSNNEKYPMLAELKISAGHHNPKILGLKKEYLLKKISNGQFITDKDLSKVDKKNSLLNDVNRLRNGQDDYTKLLILIIIKSHDDDKKELFKILHDIKLDKTIANEVITKSCGSFYLRMWEVKSK